jgi:hypothetical protein
MAAAIKAGSLDRPAAPAEPSLMVLQVATTRSALHHQGLWLCVHTAKVRSRATIGAPARDDILHAACGETYDSAYGS